MPEMSPEQMQAMEAAEGEAKPEGGQGGDVMAKVEAVGQGLSELAQMLDQSQGATDQDREEMAQLISLFTGLVERKLGGGGEQGAKPEQGVLPADGGAKGVPMGPQGRM